VKAAWVSSAEAQEFVEEIKTFVEILYKMGPSPLKKEPGKRRIQGFKESRVQG